MAEALSRKRLPLERLSQRARAHASGGSALDLETPIDRSRLFLCPTVTPLYYTPGHAELTPEQALRANQLTALSFNELIVFFETSFAPHVLTALSHARRSRLPLALVEGLAEFLAEEAQHSEMFRRLDRLCEPAWYAAADHRILAVPPLARAALGVLTRHPVAFPLVIWIMLAMEEHSVEVSRRCARAPEALEPHFAAVYRAHLEDEVRHVQWDWHLLEHFYERRSWAVRRLNAALLPWLLGRFFLAPRLTGRRVVEVLVRERPELAPLAPRMVRELAALESDRAYLELMYSRETTPITFALFDRFPELGGVARALPSYRREPAGSPS